MNRSEQGFSKSHSEVVIYKNVGVLENNETVSKRLQPTLYHDGHEYICLIYFSLLCLHYFKMQTPQLSPSLGSCMNFRSAELCESSCLRCPFIPHDIVFSRCIFFSHLEFILWECPSLRELKNQTVFIFCNFPCASYSVISLLRNL